MNMYILSAAQFDQIIKALDDARFALDTCQHVELDIADPKKTIALPVTEKAVKAPKSQVKTRKSSCKGRRGVAVLNEGQVLEIKQQIASGTKSVAKIARDFGVHVTTINCIKAGKTWKHVQLQQPTPVVVAD